MNQTSKTADTLILPDVASNNQPMPHPTGGTDNCKFYINYVGLGLVSGQVCPKAFPSIALMVVRALEFGDDSAWWFTKSLVNEFPLTGLHKILLGL